MKHFIPKSAVVLFVAFLCSSVASADYERNCHFAFGNGVTEQIVVPPGQPPNAHLGQIRLRIGRVIVDGAVDMIITAGFDVPAMDPLTGKGRITGFGKATFDFDDLGAFHTWEVDTVTFEGPPPWETTELVGNIRTGPARDAVADPQLPPMPWGTGFFANTDATLKGKGWMRHYVVNSEGVLVNEFTYYIFGRICNVDVRAIRQAQGS